MYVVMQPGVLEGVQITSQIVDMWLGTEPPPHAVWRYLATESGIIRIFPGIEFNKFYDPRLRPWCVKKLCTIQLILNPSLAFFLAGTLVLALRLTPLSSPVPTWTISGLVTF